MPRTSLKDLVSAILNAHSFLLNVHARLFLPRTISIIKRFTCNILSEKDGEYGRFQSIKYFSFAMMIAMKASPGNGKIMKQLDLLWVMKALTKEIICGEYADTKVWNYVYSYQFIFKTFIIIWKILQPQQLQWLARFRLLLLHRQWECTCTIECQRSRNQ